MAKRIIKKVKNSAGNYVALQKGESLRSDGMLVYRYTDAGGKRITLSSTTIEGLREKEKDLTKEKVIGVRTDVKAKTLDNVYDEWVESKRGLREHTLHNYSWLYGQYVKGGFGKTRIKNITFGDVKKFYNSLYDGKNLAISTIDGLQTVLRQVFEYAVKQRYINTNPTIDAMKELKKAYNTGEQKHKALTVAEHQRFLDYIHGHPTYGHWYPTFAVLVGSGLRVGELCGLRWCDLDFEQNKIDVNHTLIYDKNPETEKMEFSINPPKSVAGKRRVKMMSSVRSALEEERAVQSEGEVKCLVTVDGYTDFIFVNRFGHAQHQGTLNKALRRIIRDANLDALDRDDGTVLLPKFSCHNLRSTFCTRMVEAGVELKVVMSQMGHSDSRTTMEVYTSVNEDWTNREMDKVEGMLKAMNS